MRIFADHCVHTDLVESLRENRFEVERAIEVGLDRASDEEIFNHAFKKSQILLTFDKDFGNIIQFDIKNSAGIVLVYTEGMSKEFIIERVVNFFQGIKPKSFQGTLFIVEADRIRIWPHK